MLSVGILLAFTAAAVVILILRRNEVRDYFTRDGLDRTCLKCFFANSGMVLFLIMMVVNMLLMLSL